MTTAQVFLNQIAGAFAIASFVPYIIAILRKQTKPSKSTWLIWTTLSNLTAATMFASDALNAQIAMIAAGDLIVVVLALTYGTSGWSRLDLACLTGAVAGIAVWIWTRDPLHGLLIAVTVTVVGSIPTIVKTWHHPEQEDSLAYTLMVSSCVFQIAAIPAWTMAHVLQPISFLGIGGSILFLILARPKRFFAAG